MKVVHIDFTGTFDDESTYQGVLLPKAHQKLGNETFVLTTVYKWINGKITDVGASTYKLNDGLTIKRFFYRQVFNELISQKLRLVDGLFGVLDKIKPDIIMIHGLQTYAVFDIVKYCKMNPSVYLCADNHADFNNSANHPLAYILHKTIYKYIVKRNLDSIHTIFYTTLETGKFLEKMYGIKPNKTEFLPLGGFVVSHDEKITRYRRFRIDNYISDDDILVVHAGKFNKQKFTIELLESFTKTKDERLKLWLCGSFDDEIASKAKKLVNADPRIKFLGWKTGEQLNNILTGSDLYIQPGSQSAILQNAICCRTPVAVYPHYSYKSLLNDSAFYVTNSTDIINLFNKIILNRNIISTVAEKFDHADLYHLDYFWQANHILEMSRND